MPDISRDLAIPGQYPERDTSQNGRAMKLILTLLCLSFAATAQAATVSFSPSHSFAEAGNYHFFGADADEKLGQMATYRVQRQGLFFRYMSTEQSPAGRFDLTDQSGRQVYGFSLDPRRRFALAPRYETATTLANLTAARRMQRLVDLYYDTVDTDVEAAAFQMAVWEIAADARLATDAGQFRSSFFTTGGVAAYFADYIAGVAAPGSVTKSWTISYHTAEEGLNLITIEDIIPPQPVPVPPMGVALASLTALWLTQRRG